MKNLLEKLKKTDPFSMRSHAHADEVYIQLCFDEHGGYVQTVDKRGDHVDVNHLAYRGPMRELCKALTVIKDRMTGLIGWDSSGEHIYLHEHEHLIWLLRGCDCVMDSKCNPVTFAEEAGKVVLDLRPYRKKEGQLIGNLLLIQTGKKSALGDVRFLNENHLLRNSEIIEVQPLGENYNQLYLFADAFVEDQLEQYLTLLFSYFTHIQLAYGDYRVQEGPALTALPALQFQRVTEDRCLHLNITNTLPGFSDAFFTDYDITQVARVNEMESLITLQLIRFDSLEDDHKYLSRLLNATQKKLKAGGSMVYSDENGFILEPELANLFLLNELPALLRRFTLQGADKLTQFKIKAVKPELNVKLGYGVDFLEGDAELSFGEEKIRLFEVLAQYRKQSYILLSDETRAVIHPDYLARLSRLFQKKGTGVKVSFFDLPLIDDLLEQRAEDSIFPQVRSVFQGFNTLTTRRMKSPKINGTLRPYQLHGLKWIQYLYENKLGGCLADDMGLGKTVQTIAMLSLVYPKQKKPTLLIMPKSLLFNWQKEISQFCPALTAYIYHGTERDIETATQHHLIMTTYGTLQRSIETFKEHHFHYVILDESQNIKNVQTQRTKSVLMLKADHRLALSGTPIENNLQELYSLFRFLNPAMFGSLQQFNASYITPIHQHNDKDAVHELRKKVYPFILRRLKKDVLKELPEKTEQILYVDMNPEQEALYKERRQFHHDTIKKQIAAEGLQRSRFSILAALLELRQLASVPEDKSEGLITSAKRELLVESVRDTVMNGHKALIFANFISAVELLTEELETAGIACLSMTGATRDRQSLVERFQHDDEIKVFIMTLKTGGVGLNLTAADTVFIYDPWWNTAAETQAIDRAHRIGQSRKVFTYKLIARNTIEEKILELQLKKKEMFDQIISSDSGALKSLTESDIDQILGT
ncbi:MAG: DEAD/DEAH box helicase [Spartobacteria bacterium]|nr:DEAD/DEAH box helicase [Spartobacteria bacterium]